MRQYIRLVEVMRLTMLLLESRIDFLKQNFLPRIEQAIEAGLNIPPNIQAGIALQEGETEAEKFFNFVLACDPDPVKKNSQWLLTQILRKNNAMPLEDLEGASETLKQYAEMKKARQIPANKSDINAFKSLSELNSVVRGEEQTQVQKVDAEEAAMFAQSDVLLNNSKVLVLIPKTAAAACYFGRTTDWCTAWGDHREYGLSDRGKWPTRTNQFQNYQRYGPLYIVIEKENGAHWQLSFGADQFMDAQDRPFNVASLVKRHPEIFKAIGEENFMGIAQELGLSFFSPETRAQIPDRELGRMIKSRADLKLIPLEKQREYDFVESVCAYQPEAIRWFPADVVEEYGQKLTHRVFAVFKYLPEHLQTQKLADSIAPNLSWQALEKSIPQKFWSETVSGRYWVQKSIDTNLHLKDIPEEFQQRCAYICLAKHPNDIVHYEHLLDTDNVPQIVSKNVKAIESIPSRFLTQDVAEVLSSKIGRNQYDTGLRELWKYFDSKYWPESAVKWMIEHGKLDFAKMPEHLKTIDNLEILVNKNPKEAAHIPEHYWKELLPKVVSKYGSVLNYINPSYVPEDFLANLPNMPGAQFDSFFYDHSLPKALKTSKVVAAFASKGYVEVKDLPKNLRTEENVLKRIKNNYAETKDIPHDMFNKDFAIRLVQANKESMNDIPTSCYSEPLLFTWLTKINQNKDVSSYNYYHYGVDKAKTIFNQFPKSMWSSRTVAEAIDAGLIEPKKSLIPPELMNKDVAQAIIAKNHEDVADLDTHLDDESLVHALERNWRLLKTIPPEKITEPMAYAAMKAHAQHASDQNRSSYYRKIENETLPLLKNIPKRVWSKRVYEEAVGLIVPLKAVPAKWRDNELIKKAVLRDPSNITVLADPAKWLTDNLPGEARGDIWKNALEAAGVAVIKNKYVDVRNLPRETLPSGVSYSILKAGTTNLRAYFFDKKGNYVFYLYTNKGEVKMPHKEIEKAKPYVNDVITMAREKLTGFNTGDLNEIGIYGNSGRFRTEAQSSKTKVGDMEWSNVQHLKSEKYTAWIEQPTKKPKAGSETDQTEQKKQYKPAIELYVESTGSWGNSGNTRITKVNISNLSYCLAHSLDIAKFINAKIRTDSYGTDLKKLGIYFDKNKYARSIAEYKIGTIGNFSIWRNDDKKIGIFGPEGLIGRGIVRANGKVDKIEASSGLINAVEKMFDRISQVLMKNKTATGISLSEMLRRIGRRL